MWLHILFHPAKKIRTDQDGYVTETHIFNYIYSNYCYYLSFRTITSFLSTKSELPN